MAVSVAQRVQVLLALTLAAACARTSDRSTTGATTAPLIVIGLDGADWQFIDRLVAAGGMPRLAQLMREGQSGVLVTQHPPLSPLVWTTMLTGKSPLEHGVLDFTRFHPRSRTREPITSDERRVPAVWNMLDSQQLTSAVFGMWATYPAEAIDGVIVSDRLYSFQQRDAVAPANSVFPASEQAPALEVLARTEQAIDARVLQRYLPWVSSAEKDPLVGELRRVLVQTEVYDALAREALRQRRDALTVVYFQGTDEIGHLFASFVSPRPAWIDDAPFARYAGVVERYYNEIDTRLGVYRQLAAQRGARLLVVSDHGFRWGDDRPRQAGMARAATAAQWHRDDGIWLLWGDAIQAAPRAVTKSRVDQVCATILALLNLPAGIGLAGPPLASIPDASAPPVDYGALYRPAPAVDASIADERVEQLRSLGYVGSSEPSRATSRDSDQPTRTAGSFSNEALILRAAGRIDEAQAALEHALERDPQHAASLWNLSDLLASAGKDPARSDRLLLQALESGLSEGVPYVLARSATVRKLGDTARAAALLEGALQRAPESAPLYLYRARLRSEAQDCRGALDDALTAQRWAPGEATAYALAGVSRLCLGDQPGARREFARSLQLDPDQPKIRAILDR
ncbi:MAG: alkaline phosphatase family protein [Acidobacteriota bacterium]